MNSNTFYGTCASVAIVIGCACGALSTFGTSTQDSATTDTVAMVAERPVSSYTPTQEDVARMVAAALQGYTSSRINEYDRALWGEAYCDEIAAKCTVATWETAITYG